MQGILLFNWTQSSTIVLFLEIDTTTKPYHKNFYFLFRDLSVVLNVEITFLISWSLKTASGKEGGVEGSKESERIKKINKVSMN